MTTHRTHRSARIARTAVAVAAVAATSVGCAADAGAADDDALRIGQLVSYSTFAISEDAGLGTELSDGTPTEWVTGFEAFVPALEAANADEIDAGSGGLTNLFTGLNAGGDLLALGVEDSSEAMGIVASGESGITDVEDLAGHSIAVNQGGTGEYLALRALDRAGIDPADVDIEYLTPADGIAAFQSGNVDAIAVWDQYFATAQLQPDARVVATGEDLESLNYLFAWVTRDYAEAHPDEVQALIADLQGVSDATAADPESVLDYYRGLGASDDVLDVVAEWDPYTFEPIGDEQIALIEQHGEDLLRYGLIDEVPDLSDAFVQQDDA